MKNTNNLFTLIEKEDWPQISQFDPEFLVKNLSFKQGLYLAYHLLLNEQGDDDLRDYSVKLLKEIKKNYEKDWSADWKNDVFYGDACYLTLHYDEVYESYKKASEKVNPVPPSLLLCLAGCYLLFDRPISEKEAKELVQKALDQEITVEGAILMRGLCSEDKAQFDYWDKVWEEAEQKNLHTASSWPTFPKNIYED
jgi:hypothetical protein